LRPDLDHVHAGYFEQLARAPLSEATRRAYASKFRGYLAWPTPTPTATR
jgi:hypothetical protein